MASNNDGAKKLSDLEEKIGALSVAVNEMQATQKQIQQHVKMTGLAVRLENIEKRQEDTMKLLTGLRSELAGISSGMARRDSLMLGSGVVPGLTSLRRDSLILDGSHRRDSLILGNEMIVQAGKGGSIPVMEVEPWEPNSEIQEVIDRLMERQFLLSPWVREKRLRNQLRLVLKDALDAGPRRRSTVTKIVHDAHQLYPIWRNQLREIMFENWERIQEMEAEKAAEIIFARFKKPRFPDELESVNMYAEHMVEVGQYLRRKASERAERAGKPLYTPGAVTNSKFWYEVRKKITEILETKRATGARRRSSLQLDDDESDDEGQGSRLLCKQDTQDSIVSEDEEETESDEKEKLKKAYSNDSSKSY